MVDGTDPEERGSGIDWPATFAGAAAAVTVAVLLSTLGAAGTLIGAALGSVVATVSAAFYKQGIEHSRRRVAEVQAAALQRDAARAHRHVASDEVEEVQELAEVEATPSRWAALPWRRIALLAAVVFLLALVVISAVELVAGRSVSSITGGTDGKDRTSIGGVLDGGEGDGRGPRRTPTEESTAPTPSGSATPTAPTSGTPTTAPTEPASPSPTVTVTVTATPEPTPSGEPSVSATP